MTRENRFEGLMGAVGKNKTAQTSKRSDVQASKNRKKTSSQSNVESSKNIDISTSKQSDVQTSITQDNNYNSDISTSKKAKSANPDYTRTTVYLPKKMHKKLKAIALDEEREMSSIVEELIKNWLSERGKDV